MPRPVSEAQAKAGRRLERKLVLLIYLNEYREGSLSSEVVIKFIESEIDYEVKFALETYHENL